MRSPAVLLLLCALCVLCCCTGVVCGSSSSSSSSSGSPSFTSSSASTGGAASVGGSLVLTSFASAAFPPRSFASCAADLTQSPTNGSAAAYLIGGYNGAIGSITLYNDVWRSTAFSFSSAAPPFVSVAQSPSAPAPFSSGGGAAVLLNGALLQFGGQDGVAGNDVFTSQDGGTSWYLVTLNAPWSSRSLFASCVLPATDVVVIAAGQLSTSAPSPPFNSSDVWISQDGLGLSWSEANANAPFGAVLSAAMVGLYDHSIVLCGGERNQTLINECWLSQSLGQTWTMQPAAPWSPRYGHSLAVDADDLIYVVGGSTSISPTAAAPLEVWVSNTRGASWAALQLSTASSSFGLAPSVLFGCSFIRQLQPGGVKQLVLYSGSDGSGQSIGVVAGNITISSGLAPPSSTAIPLASSAGATTKPAVPSSTAAALYTSSSPASTSSTTGAGSGASTATSTASRSSSSSSTGNTQTSGSKQRYAPGLALSLLLLVTAFGSL